MPRYSAPQARIHYKRKTDKQGYLLLKIQYQKKLINFYLSQYLHSHHLPSIIEKKYWDPKSGQTIFNRKYAEEYKMINDKLREIKAFIDNLFKSNPEITHDEIKLEIEYFTGKKERPIDQNKKQSLSLFDFIDQFIIDKKREGKRGTWKKFITVKSHLEYYSKEKRIKLNYDNIDWQFRNKFLQWLYGEPRKHSANNASKLFEVLKQFLKESYRLGYHTNEIFNDSGFGIKRVKTKNKVRLNFDELRVLQNLELSGNLPFEKVRDLFLVGCFTGLRFSDWHKVKKENIIIEEGNELLEIFTQKTSTPVFIPLLSELKAILEKYEYKLPKLSSQFFNRVIKQVCELANLDSMEMRIYSEGGVTMEERMEKYKMVSSHCARRSFASNFYRFGISPFILMQITGHATEKQFFDYIDLSKKDLAKEFAKQVELKKKESRLKVVS